MHYLDITIGDNYLYRGTVVKATGTRVVCKANHSREDIAFVSIQLDAFTGREVQPHELSPIPADRLPMDGTREATYNSAYYGLAQVRDDCAILAKSLHPSFQQIANECQRLKKEMQAFKDTYTLRNV